MRDLTSFLSLLASGVYMMLSQDLSTAAPLVLSETNAHYNVCKTEICEERAMLLKASFNESLNPCDDFYSFVCDGWIAKNPIPPYARSHGTFEETHERVTRELKELVENITDSSEPSNLTDIAGNFYRTCLESNFTQHQLIGLWGDLLVFRRFSAWPIVDPKSVRYTTYKEILANTSLWPIFSVGVSSDLQDKERFIVELGQMPFPVLGRNELVNWNQTTYNRKIALSYVYLIATAILVLNPYATIAESLPVAERIFLFESQLASMTMAPEHRRDISSMYKKVAIQELRETFPSLPILNSLNKMLSLANITINETEKVAMTGMAYFNSTMQFLDNEKLVDIYNFVAWRYVCDFGLLTSIRFSRAYLELTRILTGIEEPLPRWQYCVRTVNNVMPFVVGKLYVEKHFHTEVKSDVEEIVRTIKNSLEESIFSNNWLDNETKNPALYKVQNMTSKIGFPEWMNEDAYMEQRFKFVGNISRNEPFATLVVKYSRNAAIMEMLQLRKPPNKTAMWTGPATENAYHRFAENEIVFPAAILRGAFYRHGLPQSVNYGGIGSVIGHEMMHGFDDVGSQFDEKGLLRNWWTNGTRKKFNKKAQCFINQYTAEFSGHPNTTVNGVNTLGENIADNGGFRLAYKSLSAQLNDSAMADIRLPGLENYTSKQLYFISNAFVWCGSVRPNALKLQTEYDPHAPRRLRNYTKDALIGSAKSPAFITEIACTLGRNDHLDEVFITTYKKDVSKRTTKNYEGIFLGIQMQ